VVCFSNPSILLFSASARPGPFSGLELLFRDYYLLLHTHPETTFFFFFFVPTVPELPTPDLCVDPGLPCRLANIRIWTIVQCMSEVTCPQGILVDGAYMIGMVTALCDLESDLGPLGLSVSLLPKDI
jgi:hypothetical protein